MNLAVLLVLVAATLYLLWKVMALSLSLVDFWQARAHESAEDSLTEEGKVSS